MTELEDRFRRAYRACTTFPLGRGPEGPAASFRRLAEAADELGLARKRTSMASADRSSGSNARWLDCSANPMRCCSSVG